MPAETDRRDDRIGQAGARIGIDLGALDAVVRADRKANLEAVEASEQLLLRDAEICETEHRSVERRVERQ